MARWNLHCRSFNTVLHTLADPITGQRSQDSPIRQTIYNRTSPTHFSPSSQHFPHSFILFSSHPFCSAVISHFVSSKWLLTVLTELSFFVCLYHKCVCQSHALCIFSSLFWPILHLREIAKLCFWFFFFLGLEPLAISLLYSSGIPYCSMCSCCAFLTNLFSLWLPFSQSLPSLQAFSPTLIHCYSLCLSPTLSFILSLYSLSSSRGKSPALALRETVPFNSLDPERRKMYSSPSVSPHCVCSW